jgi:hypothetical protein
VAFPDAWRKYLPGDATSAWWYTVDDLKRLVFSHISESQQRGGTDLLLRYFIKTFRNLSANTAAKAVCATLPTMTRLSDFAHQAAAVETLHAAMRRTGKPPSPAVLGTVGDAHFRSCFDAWYGVQRFWYATSADLYEGLPFVVEVAVAETRAQGEVWTGLNFSPTFEDPLSQAWLSSPKVDVYGLRNFLLKTDALPQSTPWEGEHGARSTRRAVALHLTCPVLTFLDRGKTRLRVPIWMARPVAKALWTATRDLYNEAEARKKNAAKQERQDAARAREAAAATDQWTLKDAVYAVMPEAWEHATGHGTYRVSKRFLFYAVRSRIQPYTTKPLDYTYFSQDLLTQYQGEHGALHGLYADPRGVLYEPHTGTEIALGTTAVETYTFPAWRYDKMLYVEKKGLWPI